MVIETKRLFEALQLHHRMPAATRPLDLTGRISILIDDPATHPDVRRGLVYFRNREIARQQKASVA